MNKRLLAVAVAGVFAAPAVAFAQSSVTISGTFKGGFESLKYGNYSRAVGPNSQTGVVDDSSRLIFNVVEDLGGGLQAIGQIDNRFSIDGGAFAASGNTHVGLRSKSWGRIFFGRQDLHYFNTESNLTDKGSLRASPVSLLSYVVNPAGASQSIANATRTPNVVHYTSPNWGGFTVIAAYSSSQAAGQETDIGSGVRKGRAWNLNPNFQGSNWQIGYSYWTGKQDAGGNTTALGDQRGDRPYGSYVWGGFKFGLAWDKSKVKGAASGTTLNDRTAWSIPLSYTWGAHSIHVHFDKARADKAAQFAGLETKANMFAIAYAYDLSKRTSAALTYARINNGAAANYNMFASTSLGLGNTAPLGGEDPRMWGVTLRHQF